jgi:hypothetical protein
LRQIINEDHGGELMGAITQQPPRGGFVLLYLNSRIAAIQIYFHHSSKTPAPEEDWPA